MTVETIKRSEAPAGVSEYGKYSSVVNDFMNGDAEAIRITFDGDSEAKSFWQIAHRKCKGSVRITRQKNVVYLVRL